FQSPQQRSPARFHTFERILAHLAMHGLPHLLSVLSPAAVGCGSPPELASRIGTASMKEHAPLQDDHPTPDSTSFHLFLSNIRIVPVKLSHNSRYTIQSQLFRVLHIVQGMGRSGNIDQKRPESRRQAGFVLASPVVQILSKLEIEAG
ncbi:unnamed protein product, partial [Mycena citricolor]